MNCHRPRVALDFDGTLVSCKEKQIYALKIACMAHSIEYSTYDSFWDLKRNGASTYKALISTGVSKLNSTSISDFWKDFVESEEACNQDTLFPGVVSALEKLSESAQLILLSARRNSELLEHQIRDLGLSQLLDHWEIVSPLAGVSESKANRLKFHQAICYVGDTEHDMMAARSANIPGYILATGQRSEEFIIKQSNTESPLTVYKCFQDAAKDIENDLLR